ncbi:MAG TPA: hypothetical protein DC064_31630 [Cyanobacteria bacterium UBA9273]|nr:hypothetical protein [Cyanobacteria bacterium UBA9273]
MYSSLRSLPWLSGRSANLSGAYLSGANVNRTIFRNNQGISKTLKQDLIRRGAVFDDSPGDRSEVLVRT